MKDEIERLKPGYDQHLIDIRGTRRKRKRRPKGDPLVSLCDVRPRRLSDFVQEPESLLVAEAQLAEPIKSTSEPSVDAVGADNVASHDSALPSTSLKPETTEALSDLPQADGAELSARKSDVSPAFLRRPI